MAEELKELYDGAHNSSATLSQYYWCQTFTTTSQYYITGIELFGYNLGGSGILTVEIFAVDGSHQPTGAALCSGTIDVTTIGGTEEWFLIDIVTPYEISDATEYAIVCSKLETATAFWQGVLPGGYASGQSFYSSDKSSWSSSSSDKEFKVYGDTEGGTEYVDLTASITDESEITGTLSFIEYVDLTASITDESEITGTLTISVNWKTDSVTRIKRLIAIGNDSLYYEDI